MQKRSGRITGETSQIVKVVPAKKTNEVILSKIPKGKKAERELVIPKRAKHYVMQEINEEKQTAQVSLRFGRRRRLPRDW